MSKPTVDDAVYQYMLKKEAEGKPKKLAKIAALNKFLRIYFARTQEINRQNGQTIIMVIHSPEAAKCSSRIITVMDGLIA